VNYENTFLANLYDTFLCKESKTDYAISRGAKSVWLQRNSSFSPLVSHKASIFCHSDASYKTHLFNLISPVLLHVVGFEVKMQVSHFGTFMTFFKTVFNLYMGDPWHTIVLFKCNSAPDISIYTPKSFWTQNIIACSFPLENPKMWSFHNNSLELHSLCLKMYNCLTRESLYFIITICKKKTKCQAKNKLAFSPICFFFGNEWVVCIMYSIHNL